MFSFIYVHVFFSSIDMFVVIGIPVLFISILFCGKPCLVEIESASAPRISWLKYCIFLVCLLVANCYRRFHINWTCLFVCDFNSCIFNRFSIFRSKWTNFLINWDFEVEVFWEMYQLCYTLNWLSEATSFNLLFVSFLLFLLGFCLLSCMWCGCL